jgi:hypothetical protein
MIPKEILQTLMFVVGFGCLILFISSQISYSTTVDPIQSSKVQIDEDNYSIDKLVHTALLSWKEIREEDVAKATGEWGFRIQKINNEFYFKSEITTGKYETRNEAIKLFLLALQNQYNDQIPNGIDFFIDTSDGNSIKGPGMTFCSNRGLNMNHTFPGDKLSSIPIPDFTFYAWPEVGISSHFSTYSRILSKAGEPKQNRDQAVFVGAMFPRRVELLTNTSSHLVKIEHHRSVCFTIYLIFYYFIGCLSFSGKKQSNKLILNRGGNFVPLETLCTNQYLLHLPGWVSYSSRLKYLLLCNSTVVVVDDINVNYDNQAENFKLTPEQASKNNDVLRRRNGYYRSHYEEWYYPLVVPYLHFLPARNGVEVNRAMMILKSNPKLAELIAQNGVELAKKIFHPSFVNKYWLKLLQTYSERMTYRVTEVTDDAVPLTTWALTKLA